VPVAAGPATIEIDLYIGLRQLHSGRTAVNDAAERNAVAFAKRRH
jgi:hypothetical protein